jgi:hypothetical protein
LYAFLNASIQGTTRMAQTLAGTSRAEDHGGRRRCWGAMSAMLGIAMMGGEDDDEWAKIPEFVKERSIIIPIGRQDKYITIPMPLGFHFLPNIGRLAVEMAFYKDKTARQADGEPLHGPGGRLQPPGRIGAGRCRSRRRRFSTRSRRWLQNKDWTGKPIYIENFNSLDPQPGTQRAKDSATPWAKGFAEAINAVTGGTEYTPGGWSPTPDQIDYVIGQLTGGLGREAGKVAATAAAPIHRRRVAALQDSAGWAAVREHRRHVRAVRAKRSTRTSPRPTRQRTRSRGGCARASLWPITSPTTRAPSSSPRAVTCRRAAGAQRCAAIRHDIGEPRAVRRKPPGSGKSTSAWRR